MKSSKPIKWKIGLIYQALHNVGDDCVKSQIERDLSQRFIGQNDVLDAIAKIFVENTRDDSNA